MNRALWIIQSLLAILFLFAGGSKFTMPVDQMVKGMPPALANGTFIHFIAVCEILGAFGLTLPMLLRIAPMLTPIAAAGLLLIMAGAVITTLPLGFGMAAFPLVTALLLAFVAWGRWRLAPMR